ncbi:MAG: Adenine deaminase [Syntrophus sp. PtaU1.Bin005]|jgi:adenine deaminase|nr:MAG: Adenine deaminase [Syntrophus sp. PtaU1.Bin005]
MKNRINFEEDTARSRRLADVARQKEPAETLIQNGTLFNAFTGEFLPGQSLWIAGGRIAYAGPDSDCVRDDRTEVIDAEGMTLLPGLIDGHTHILMRSGLEEFIRHVLPGGTTTIITELIEFASFFGILGIEPLVRALKDQPIRFYYTLPPLCALTPALERTAPDNAAYLPYLEDPECMGVGEIYWSNLFLEGTQGSRVQELARMAILLGKRAEGHTAGAPAKSLQAYTGFGFSSDHEPITAAEAMDRLRLGYWVMVRQGSIRKELPEIAPLFRENLDFRRMALCTDSVDPQELLEQGYLEGSLRSALKLGIPPAQAYQMVTINVAEHFRLDHQLGSLSPGKAADVVVIPSPAEYEPRRILIAGKTVFSEGKTLVEPRHVEFPEALFSSVRIAGYQLEEPRKAGRCRAMELVNRLVTREKIIDFDNPEDAADVLYAAALNRTGGGKSFTGFLKGFGLKMGACGTTTSWDTVDMLCAGADMASIRTVIERLREIGGGAVFAIGETVVAECPLPLCGVVSLAPLKTLSAQMRNLDEALQNAGARWEKPVLTLDTLTTASIPHLRITHEGYVRMRDRKILPLSE